MERMIQAGTQKQLTTLEEDQRYGLFVDTIGQYFPTAPEEWLRVWIYLNCFYGEDPRDPRPHAMILTKSV